MRQYKKAAVIVGDTSHNATIGGRIFTTRKTQPYTVTDGSITAHVLCGTAVANHNAPTALDDLVEGIAGGVVRELVLPIDNGDADFVVAITSEIRGHCIGLLREPAETHDAPEHPMDIDDIEEDESNDGVEV